MKDSTGKMLTSKDIHNLRQRQNLQSASEEDNLLKVLEELMDKDPNASVTIFVNKQNELEVLYVQTGKMNEMVSNFPEVIILDSTYQVNNKRCR